MTTDDPTDTQPAPSPSEGIEDPEATSEPPKAAVATRLGPRNAVLVAVVIGLFGYLAVIAFLNFASMGMRAKRSEGPNYLDGIRAAELARHGTFGEFLSAGPCPTTPPGRQAVAWEGECAKAFWDLGWAADGTVRCQYTAMALPSEGADADFKLTARCDSDGDGDPSIFEASRNSPATRVTPRDIY